MANKRRAWATSNLAMLELVARRLGNLNKEVVYLGGCATALFINDPLSLDVRATVDVDCIVDVVSLIQYQEFERELRKKGFKKSMEDDVICRWHHEEVTLDVMPTDEKILGFGNPWYKEALKNAVDHKIADDLIVKSVTAPYFLATKFEAFKSRGNNDLLASHDYEDIITILAGRVEIAEEVTTANPDLSIHLKAAFEKLLRNEEFERTLPGHVEDGPVTMQRVQTVLDRIKRIIK